MDAVPRETWEQLFRSQGMKNPIPRIRMLDGFNDGWIEFENGDAGSRRGEVALKSVLQTLVEREGSSRDSDPHPCCGNISPDSWEPRASPTGAPSGTRTLGTVLA